MAVGPITENPRSPARAGVGGGVDRGPCRGTREDPRRGISWDPPSPLMSRAAIPALARAQGEGARDGPGLARATRRVAAQCSPPSLPARSSAAPSSGRAPARGGCGAPSPSRQPESSGRRRAPPAVLWSQIPLPRARPSAGWSPRSLPLPPAAVAVAPSRVAPPAFPARCRTWSLRLYAVRDQSGGRTSRASPPIVKSLFRGLYSPLVHLSWIAPPREQANRNGGRKRQSGSAQYGDNRQPAPTGRGKVSPSPPRNRESHPGSTLGQTTSPSRCGRTR